ncbi:MAG: tetratricopeptide repeat protein [Acidobacteriota bacterium]
MKRCPHCRRDYLDETLSFCLDDGTALLEGPASEPDTAILPSDISTSEPPPRQIEQPLRDENAAARTSLASRPWILPLIVVAVLSAAGFIAYVYWPSGDRVKPIDSVAVLPFQNKNTDADTEYLSDGLAESLIYRLSQLPDLKVSPTSSVFRYQGTEIDPVKVGTELGVSAVLSGRIVQHGDRLTISAELTDVRNNKLLWGEQYDRKISELLSTQREIAREIVDKLRLRISGDERGIAKQYTESNEAYQLYLKGRFYWGKRNADPLKKAIDYFNQAIEIDPGFALAYAGLADCYVVPAIQMAPRAVMPKAKAAAIRALELDDSLAEAHTALARVYMSYEWNWPLAEREFKRAIDLDPRYAVAHQWYGGYLEATGHHDEAIAERKLALDLDPLSPIINFELGQAYFYSRDYDRAIDQYQKALELDPTFPPANQFLPVAFELKGDVDKAIALFKASPLADKAGEFSMTTAGLGYAYAKKGQKAEALAVLDDLRRISGEGFVPSSSFALLFAGLGDKDQAFLRLEKAYEEHEFQLQWLAIEPRWDSLRSDPRFTNLISRIGLLDPTSGRNTTNL